MKRKKPKQKQKDLRLVNYSYRDIEEGDYVKFTGCSREQVNWGNNTDPDPLLVYGGVYYVQELIVKSSHSKLVLRGVEGKFNSVCLERLGK